MSAPILARSPGRGSTFNDYDDGNNEYLAMLLDPDNHMCGLPDGDGTPYVVKRIKGTQNLTGSPSYVLVFQPQVKRSQFLMVGQRVNHPVLGTPMIGFTSVLNWDEQVQFSFEKDVTLAANLSVFSNSASIGATALTGTATSTIFHNTVEYRTVDPQLLSPYNTSEALTNYPIYDGVSYWLKPEGEPGLEPTNTNTVTRVGSDFEFQFAQATAPSGVYPAGTVASGSMLFTTGTTIPTLAGRVQVSGTLCGLTSSASAATVTVQFWYVNNLGVLTVQASIVACQLTSAAGTVSAFPINVQADCQYPVDMVSIIGSYAGSVTTASSCIRVSCPGFYKNGAENPTMIMFVSNVGSSQVLVANGTIIKEAIPNQVLAQNLEVTFASGHNPLDQALAYHFLHNKNAPPSIMPRSQYMGMRDSVLPLVTRRITLRDSASGSFFGDVWSGIKSIGKSALTFAPAILAGAGMPGAAQAARFLGAGSSSRQSSLRGPPCREDAAGSDRVRYLVEKKDEETDGSSFMLSPLMAIQPNGFEPFLGRVQASYSRESGYVTYLFFWDQEIAASSLLSSLAQTGTPCLCPGSSMSYRLNLQAAAALVLPPRDLGEGKREDASGSTQIQSKAWLVPACVVDRTLCNSQHSKLPMYRFRMRSFVTRNPVKFVSGYVFTPAEYESVKWASRERYSVFDDLDEELDLLCTCASHDDSLVPDLVREDASGSNGGNRTVQQLSDELDALLEDVDEDQPQDEDDDSPPDIPLPPPPMEDRVFQPESKVSSDDWSTKGYPNSDTAAINSCETALAFQSSEERFKGKLPMVGDVGRALFPIVKRNGEVVDCFVLVGHIPMFESNSRSPYNYVQIPDTRFLVSDNLDDDFLMSISRLAVEVEQMANKMPQYYDQKPRYITLMCKTSALLRVTETSGSLAVACALLHLPMQFPVSGRLDSIGAMIQPISNGDIKIAHYRATRPRMAFGICLSREDPTPRLSTGVLIGFQGIRGSGVVQLDSMGDAYTLGRFISLLRSEAYRRSLTTTPANILEHAKRIASAMMSDRGISDASKGVRAEQFEKLTQALINEQNPSKRALIENRLRNLTENVTGQFMKGKRTGGSEQHAQPVSADTRNRLNSLIQRGPPPEQMIGLYNKLVKIQERFSVADDEKVPAVRATLLRPPANLEAMLVQYQNFWTAKDSSGPGKSKKKKKPAKVAQGNLNFEAL